MCPWISFESLLWFCLILWSISLTLWTLCSLLFEAFLLYFGVVLYLWGQFLCLWTECVFLCHTVWITYRNTGFSSLFTQMFGPETFGLNPKALFNNPCTMLSRQFWERVTGDTLWSQSTLNEMNSVKWCFHSHQVTRWVRQVYIRNVWSQMYKTWPQNGKLMVWCSKRDGMWERWSWSL